MSLQQYDYNFRGQVKIAKTTYELDKLAFNRVRSIARAEQEPVRTLLLEQLASMKKILLSD